MLRLVFIVFALLGCASSLQALDGEQTHTIAGQEAGFYFSGLDKPILVLWHQFDLQTAMGIPAGRASWEVLLQHSRGEPIQSQYNILAIDHPWKDAEAARRFEWRSFAQLVYEIHYFLRRRGLQGAVYTMGASAGGALAIFHCDLLPNACQGVVAVGAYNRFDEVDVAALVQDDCYHGIDMLVLNSPGDGMAWLLAQPADGVVWRKISQFFGLEPPREQPFKGGDASAILLARAMTIPGAET